MEINLTVKQKKAIKKISGKATAEEVVQKVVDNWFENLIRIKYKSNKTTAQKVDEINA